MPSSAALASPPDYSHLTDDELRTAVWVIAAGLSFMAAIGVIGWLRYRRGYTPAPGRFSPVQALLSVGIAVVLTLLAAWGMLT